MTTTSIRGRGLQPQGGVDKELTVSRLSNSPRLPPSARLSPGPPQRLASSGSEDQLLGKDTTVFEVPVALRTGNLLLQVNRCDTVHSLRWRTQQEGSMWALERVAYRCR